MSARKAFWNWFVEHEPKLFDLDLVREVEQQRIFDEVARALQKVHLDLTFEFGPKNTKREFVISAGGIKRAFPAIVSLVAAAPALERWEVIAFRPRRPPMIIELGEKRVDPRSVRFTLLDNGKMAGISLFIPGFREDDLDLKQIGYLLLDEALGEYDVETRLGLIEFLSPDARTDGERFPLIELAPLFDRLVARIERRSGKPS